MRQCRASQQPDRACRDAIKRRRSSRAFQRSCYTATADRSRVARGAKRKTRKHAANCLVLQPIRVTTHQKASKVLHEHL